MNDLTNDYAADVAAKQPTAEQLAKVVSLARLLYKLQGEVEAQEADLILKQEELRRCAEVDLPDAMSAADVSEQPLGGGWVAKLRTEVLSSISLKAKAKDAEGQAKQEAALACLEQRHPDIIKRNVSIFFSRDQMAWFKKFMRDLARRKRPLDARANFYVEPQTFAAYIREQVAADPAFPKEIFGVFEKTFVTLLPPTNNPPKRGKK